MIGRGGNDLYFVDNAGDRAFEAAGGGTDSLQHVSFALSDRQEIEVVDDDLGVTKAINLTGNSFEQ